MSVNPALVADLPHSLHMRQIVGIKAHVNRPVSYAKLQFVRLNSRRRKAHTCCRRVLSIKEQMLGKTLEPSLSLLHADVRTQGAHLQAQRRSDFRSLTNHSQTTACRPYPHACLPCLYACLPTVGQEASAHSPGLAAAHVLLLPMIVRRTDMQIRLQVVCNAQLRLAFRCRHCARSLYRLYKSCCSRDMGILRSAQPRFPPLLEQVTTPWGATWRPSLFMFVPSLCPSVTPYVPRHTPPSIRPLARLSNSLWPHYMRYDYATEKARPPCTPPRAANHSTRMAGSTHALRWCSNRRTGRRRRSLGAAAPEPLTARRPPWGTAPWPARRPWACGGRSRRSASRTSASPTARPSPQAARPSSLGARSGAARRHEVCV